MPGVSIALMQLLDKNYFDLLGVPRRFAIDEQALESAYRELVSAVHPDRFVTESPEQRRLAMQAATLANEAWRCLRDPCSRAAYLCRLAGVSIEAAARKGASADFLTAQMEWREALDEARLSADRSALAALSETVVRARSQLLTDVANMIDTRDDLEAAAGLVGQLMYIDRLSEQVGDALDDLS
jgi:molecular chaperone HscB